jgi:xanthine/uracil permease
MGAELLPVAVALVVGLLSIPVCYCYTFLCKFLSPVEMLGLAIAILVAVLVISVFLTRGRVKNKMYYGKAMLQ